MKNPNQKPFASPAATGDISSLLEGLLEFGPQMGEIISNVDETTASLRNMSDVANMMFGNLTLRDAVSLEKTFADVRKDLRTIERAALPRESLMWRDESELAGIIRAAQFASATFSQEFLPVPAGPFQGMFEMADAVAIFRDLAGHFAAHGSLLDSLIHFFLPESAETKHGKKPAPTPVPRGHRDVEKMEKLAQGHYKPEYTSLEKMGFIMSGAKVQNPYEQRQLDLLQKIADNTSRAPAAGNAWPQSPAQTSIVTTDRPVWAGPDVSQPDPSWARNAL